MVFRPGSQQGNETEVGKGEITHNDASDATRGIAVFTKPLRDSDENCRWQSHVEDAVLLGLAMLKLLQVFIEVGKRLVLVVLA